MIAKSSVQQHVIHGVLHADGKGYWAECKEIAVVTQGRTLNAVIRNLKEAISLYLEGEDLESLGLSNRMRLRLSLELPLKF
ncbi:MAG TPA: type II toxin-antitoxin system HicB family antitoxin [Terriglobales bacterium]|nr:type II toxin-antitoxin system HicB family antitoxin [Terriglobales bacterium]